MHRVAILPTSMARFHEIGGVVEFASFEDASGDPDEALNAICEVVPHIDKERLRAIGFRQVDDKQFYGDRYELETHSLLTDEFLSGAPTRRRFREIGDARANSGGSIPEAGAGGQFAFAFVAPPYTLTGTANEIQNLFDKIMHFILPTGVGHEILDWTSADLPKASPYFEDGMEWWGVFLFTLYVPEYRRLTVAWASTTD